MIDMMKTLMRTVMMIIVKMVFDMHLFPTSEFISTWLVSGLRFSTQQGDIIKQTMSWTPG